MNLSEFYYKQMKQFPVVTVNLVKSIIFLVLVYYSEIIVDM